MKVEQADIRKLMRDAGVSVNIIDVIESDSSLRRSGVDSLDMINVFLVIEETYGVKILDGEVTDLDSIRGIVAFLNASQNGIMDSLRAT